MAGSRTVQRTAWAVRPLVLGFPPAPVDGSEMDVDEFVQWLCCRDRDAIDAVLHALEADRETADGEVGRLRARREIARELRRTGRCRQGGDVAHRATVAALDACRTTGLCEAEPGRATLLARAAGDAAVGLLLGGCNASTDAVVRPFLGPVAPSPS